MYARQPPDQRGVKIPNNYSGNAFRQDIRRTDPPEEEAPPTQDAWSAEQEYMSSADSSERQEDASDNTPLRVSSPRLSRSGGIGFEELLIMGLVFLISQNNSKDDLAYLLLLLLFI